MKPSPRSHVVASRIVAGLAVGGLLLAVPGAAFAAGSTPTSGGSGGSGSGSASHPTCTPANFASAQTAVETQLTDRVTQLNKLVANVNGTEGQYLTAADKATLLSDLTGTELPGIQALQAKVPTDTTCPALVADAKSMVETYRVYMVMTPQADLTIVADTESAIITKVQSTYPTITAAIAAAQAQGKDVSGAQAAFTDLQAQVSAASTAVSGVSATVLAQTPAGAPGNKTVFDGAHTSVKTAHTDLTNAHTDITTIVNDLK